MSLDVVVRMNFISLNYFAHVAQLFGCEELSDIFKDKSK